MSILGEKKSQENLFDKAIETYKKAIILNPGYSLAYYNWGNCIINRAKKRREIKLYEEAAEKYELSTKYNPKFSSAFNNWGLHLRAFRKLKMRSIYWKCDCKVHKSNRIRTAKRKRIHKLG